MTQDEIIHMARELVARHGVRMCDEDGETHGEELYCVGVDDIAEIIKHATANLFDYNKVKSHIQAAIITEREACAKVCDTEDVHRGNWFAAAIRARNNKE